MHQKEKAFLLKKVIIKYLQVRMPKLTFIEYIHKTKFAISKADIIQFEIWKILSQELPLKNIFLARGTNGKGVGSSILVEGYKDIERKAKAATLILY